MNRDLDEVSLAFSLWEQSRRDLRQAEDELIQMRRAVALDRARLDGLETRLAALGEQTERLLAAAIQALREFRSRGNNGV